MKILFISNIYPPHVLGGYEILCEQVVEAFETLGHQTNVLTSDFELSAPPVYKVMFSNQVFRELKLFKPFGFPPKTSRFRKKQIGKHNFQVTEHLIKKLAPEMIFIWSQLRLTLGAAYAAENSKIPVAYTFNDEHITGYKPSKLHPRPNAIVKTFLERFVFPTITYRGLRFNHVTCISQVLKANLVTTGFNPANMKVIYQGIPIHRFPKKKRPGALTTPPKILYVGRLHSDKGVHTLLEAIHHLQKQTKKIDVQLTITGEGSEEYKRQLKTYAQTNRINAIFMGDVAHQDVAELYRKHDLFIFPSIWQEPFGLTHLEAMASGTPVISTNDGGHSEFLEHNVNSLVFQKENAIDLSEKIATLIYDDALRFKIALKARQMVEKRFTLERYATDLESYLKTF